MEATRNMDWKAWPIAKLTDDTTAMGFCLACRFSTIGAAWEYLQTANGFPGIGRDRLAAAFDRFWLVNPDFNGGIEMAKKPAQKRFEGDGFPEKLPKDVTTAMEEYLTCKRDAAEASEATGEAKVKLIAIAHKHGIDRIPIEGENKFIEVGVADTVKVKTVPKDQREQAGIEE